VSDSPDAPRLDLSAVDLGLLAALLNQSDMVSWFDASTGEFFPDEDGAGQPPEDGRPWLSVGGKGSREAYDRMADFTDALSEATDPHVRDAADDLADALQGRGAFGHFRRALSRQDDSVQNAWWVFEDAGSELSALEWLVDNDVVDETAVADAVAEREQRRADALSSVTGARDRHPVLLLLNGLPASGKSATARAWAARRPGSLVLDIDLVRTLVSGADAAAQARVLAHTMAESHLLSGHDVVVPQLTARISNLVPFEEIATRTRAALVHVLLDADPETLRRRITSDAAPHRDGLDDEQLTKYSAGLGDVVRTRDVIRIDTARLAIDDVVAELERLSA
jgi:predicted kinase